jgi:hypothetical protein
MFDMPSPLITISTSTWPASAAFTAMNCRSAHSSLVRATKSDMPPSLGQTV